MHRLSSHVVWIMLCLLKIKSFHWHQILICYDDPCSSIKDYPRKVWPIFAKKEPISICFEWLFWFAVSGPSMSPNMCFESVIMCQSLDSLDHIHHTLSFSRVPLLTCIWMSGASGLGNQTTYCACQNCIIFCALIYMSSGHRSIQCHRSKWIYCPNI